MSPKGVNLGFMISAPGVPQLTRLDVLGVAVHGGREKRSRYVLWGQLVLDQIWP